MIRILPILALSACLGTGGLGSSGLKNKKTTKNSLTSSTDAPLDDIKLTNVVPVGSFIPSGNPNGVGLVVDVTTALKKQVLDGKEPVNELLGDNLNNAGYMSSLIEIEIPSFRIKISVPLSQFAYTATNGTVYFKNTLIYWPTSATTPQGLVKIVQINNIPTRAPIIFENENGDIMIVGGERNGQASPFIHRITTLSTVVDPMSVLLQKPEITPNVLPLTNSIIANWTVRHALMSQQVSVSGLVNFMVVEHINLPTFRSNFVLVSDAGPQVIAFCLNYTDSQAVVAANNPSSCAYLGTNLTETPATIVQRELATYGYRAGATTGTAVTFKMDNGIVVERL